MRVDVEESLRGHRDAWDRLVAAQRLPSPFLASWWVENAAAGRPRLVLCSVDGELVGGAAFEADRVGRGPVGVERVRMLGQGELAPDHLDVVAAPGHEDAVTDRVVGWLRGPGSRVVDLDGLAADGRLAGRLARSVIDRSVAPWADLSDGAEAYLAGRPGKVRSTVSRSRKRLEKAGCTLREVTADRAEEALADLARLHDGRWGDDSGFLGAWRTFATAAAAGLADGGVRAVELVGPDGVVAATEWDLVVGGRWCFYQAGRSTDHDLRGAGSVVKAEVITRAAAEGASEYDLLRGDEPYKADWATGRRPLVRVRFGVGALGRPTVLAATAWRTLRTRIDERRGDREVTAP
ncbi:MAG: GNAT family N-acetyltransferase [Microthrixaceae bacterium]